MVAFNDMLVVVVAYVVVVHIHIFVVVIVANFWSCVVDFVFVCCFVFGFRGVGDVVGVVIVVLMSC